jgi:hypothetical protein
MSRNQSKQSPAGASKQGTAAAASPSWRPTTVTHDEDGVPLKFLKVITGAATPSSLSTADKQELFEICDRLAHAEKYQKAADILYPCVVTDPSNAELKTKWLELIKMCNKQVMAQAAFNKEQSNKKWAAIDAAMAENPRSAGSPSSRRSPPPPSPSPSSTNRCILTHLYSPKASLRDRSIPRAEEPRSTTCR